MRFFRCVLILFFVLCSAISSLLATPSHAESFQVTDALGRTLTFSQPPTRIVSLAPSITETLFALGMDHEIVGVTTSCDYPLRATLKPKVGGLTTPNLETLVAMKPDLVISVKGLHKFELVSEMNRLQIPFYVSDPTTVKKILREIRVIGRLTGRAKAGEQLSETMEKRMAAVEATVHGHQRPAVLYVLWGDPLMTVGPGSYIEELIRISGGRGIVPSGRPAYSQLSMETVLAEDPEVLVFASEMGEATVAAEYQRWLRWTTLRAVKDHRLHTLDSNLLHRPGPRLVEGLESLAKLIHPELFPDQSAK